MKGTEVTANLARYGISTEDAASLRRVAAKLHRIAEMECGDAYGRCLERDDDGTCWETWEPYNHQGPRGRRQVKDPELAPLKRLAAIMARYPDLAVYQQTDPRGCALYVYRREQVQGRDINSMYSSIGCPVY